MITIPKFNAILSSKYFPHYSFITFKPSELKDHFKFKSLTVRREERKNRDVVQISAEAQYATYKTLCHLPKIFPYIIGISSAENDLLSFKTANLILYSLVSRIMPTFLAVNAAKFQFIEQKIYEEPNIVIVYNTFLDQERSKTVRDILLRFPKALRLVVVQGVDAIKYFDQYVRIAPSGVLHVPYGTDKYAEIATLDSGNYPILNSDMTTLLSPYLKNIKKR